MLNKFKTFKPKLFKPKRKYRLKGNVKISSMDSLEQLNKSIKDLENLKKLIEMLKGNKTISIKDVNNYGWSLRNDDVVRTVIVEALQTYVDEVEASLSRYINL